MDHSVKLWNNFLAFPSLFLQCTLFDRFPSKLSLTTNHLLENVALKWYKTVQCLGMILLPWDARNTICLALIGYFSQKHGVNSWSFLISQFFAIFVSNIFENISKPVGFLEKAMKTCFVANLPSFQENFK